MIIAAVYTNELNVYHKLQSCKSEPFYVIGTLQQFTFNDENNGS